MRSVFAILSTVFLLGATGQSGGPSGPPSASREDDFQIRINGPVHIALGDTAATVVVVNGRATIDGVVREGLLVVNGVARVTGRVEGSVTVIRGRLELAPGARVEDDVMLYRSSMTRAPDALVAGTIHHQSGFSLGASAMWLVWLSFTVVVVVAGLVFAYVAPITLTESAGYLVAQPGRSSLAALIMAAAVPALAIVSFATVIGIPLGLILVFVVIPALSFLGYLVAGAAVGSAFGPGGGSRNRYRATVVGLITLQVLAAVPLMGGLVVIVASLLGVGAFVGRAWAQRERLAPTGVLAPAAR